MIFLNIVLFLSPDTNEKILKEEAFGLLENGIQKEEVPKALELLLAYKTQYKKSNPESELVKSDLYQMLSYVGIGLILFTILYFGPNSVIGIGRGERKLKLINIYVKIVIYIIPVLILLPILINKVSNFF